MFNYIIDNLGLFEDFIWRYLAFPSCDFLGVYFSFHSNFVQIRCFPLVVKNFFRFMSVKDHEGRGIHPLKAFFACIGGCVGVGNVVSICSGVQIGGPGALFWIWITALIGMVIKYAEVYLGISYRVPNQEGGYNGGPMYFLRAAFSWQGIGVVAALLLCIYGVEIFQFSVVVQSISFNWDINPYLVTSILLALVLFAGSGGVRRVGNISSIVIPVFVVLYLGMGACVLVANRDHIPSILGTILTSAFTGHAAFGGFVGSTLLMTISQGIRRGCYTGDIAVGYASVINSETSLKHRAAGFFGIFRCGFRHFLYLHDECNVDSCNRCLARAPRCESIGTDSFGSIFPLYAPLHALFPIAFRIFYDQCLLFGRA